MAKKKNVLVKLPPTITYVGTYMVNGPMVNTKSVKETK